MRALKTAAAAAIMIAASAVPAAAKSDGGEGLAGELNDKIITLTSLGLVLFFTLVVVLGSLIQGRLEKRKEERKAAKLRQRIGW